VTGYKNVDTALEDQMRNARRGIEENILRGRSLKGGLCVFDVHATGPHDIDGEQRGIIVFTVMVNDLPLHFSVLEALQLIIDSVGQRYGAQPTVVVNPQEEGP